MKSDEISAEAVRTTYIHPQQTNFFVCKKQQEQVKQENYNRKRLPKATDGMEISVKFNKKTFVCAYVCVCVQTRDFSRREPHVNYGSPRPASVC